jgi:hypothetical protein
LESASPSDNQRLLAPIGHIPPPEAEEVYDRQIVEGAMPA